MKSTKPLRSSLALCAALALAWTASAHAQKVGVVDMDKIFSGYYKTRDAEKKITESRDTASKELEDRMSSYKQLIEEVNQLNKDVDNTALSPAAKDERKKKREDKINQGRALEQEINEFKTSREKQLRESAQRVRNSIVEDIMVAINAKVKSDNYDLVLDKSATSISGVKTLLYSTDKMDFSSDVIAALNRNAPAASAAPAASNTPAPAATAKPSPRR